MDCIFCKILAQEFSSRPVWENEYFALLLDRNPIKYGHLLLIPKQHEDYLFDLADSSYQELWAAAKTVALKLKTVVECKRVGVVVEGFGVAHVHVHLVPVNAGNELNPAMASPLSESDYGHQQQIFAEAFAGFTLPQPV